MSTDRLQYLLKQLSLHKLSEAEKVELALWIDTIQEDDIWKERLSKVWNSYQPEDKMDPDHADEILRAILSEGNGNSSEKVASLQYTPVRHGMMRWAVIAAAVIGILIILSIAFLVKKPVEKGTKIAVAQASKDENKKIIPGSNKAILTLANGSKIVLDSIHTGSLAKLGKARVIKVNSGLISYQANGQQSKAKNKVTYNTLSTPRGGQYQIELPDGSKVWLNAGSSLRFPTTFTGKERRVEMNGEAYFEITPSSSTGAPLKPFIVHITSPDGKDEGTIEVLGTHFNVNAYIENASVATTLVEGSVKVVSPSTDKKGVGRKTEARLKPGEQALMHENGIHVLKDVNLNEVIAWKNGLFDFEGNDIKTVMQQIAHWYDVDVRYENAPSAHFMGTISRSADISDVLKMLEMTGAVHFKIDGRTVVVTK